ncbi:MAG: hypothetical protein IAG13_04930 [Deltaproteobacteria bacterium]|nr:hypothetical protein [Nannocystaceae bacterium]
MSLDPKSSSPLGETGPMAIEIPGKTALLLVSLAQELGAATPGAVVSQALGLLQLVRQAKARGQRIVIKDGEREIDLSL